MLSSLTINRRFLGGKNNPRNKHDIIVTSTPIKTRTVQQMEMEWLSPVEKNSNKSHNPHVPVQENKNFEKITEDESVDKISPVNQRAPKVKEAKQLVIMDSDEEELFWTNRNKPLSRNKHTMKENQRLSNDVPRPTRKKKTQEKIKAVSTECTVEGTVNIDLHDQGIIPPKNVVDSNKAVPSVKHPLKKTSQAGPLAAEEKVTESPKSTLNLLKNFSINESSQNDDRLTIFQPLEKKRKNTSEDGGSTVRRSHRQRCKPLEFWNGEKMNISRDLVTGVECRKNNHPPKKVQKVRKSEMELETEEPEPNHRIPTNLPNTASTCKPEPSLTKKSNKQKTTSILKSRTSIRSKTNVRFSSIGTGTTINGPTSKINVKPDWLVNFTGINSVKQPLPNSENCLVFPGLNTAMGIISSAIMRMSSKAVNQSRAPDLHHLIFCVMAGTVTVTIDEISVRMENYGHFSVPCGVSYSIENTRKKEAILSFFKVACSCMSNK